MGFLNQGNIQFSHEIGLLYDALKLWDNRLKEYITIQQASFFMNITKSVNK